MPGQSTNQPGNYIALGLQSAKDTEATAFYFLKHLDGSGFDVDPDIERIREGGDGQEIGLSWRKLVKADGQLLANARPDVVGALLKGVLGNAALSGTAAGPFADVTISPVASLPYYTVDQKWADEQERNTNVKITSLDIEFEGGMPLKLTAGIVGGGTSYRPTAALSPVTRESGKPIMYTLASVVLTGAATGMKVTKGKISIKRNVDDGIQTTGLNREDVVELNADYDVDLTAKYEDAVAYRKAQYDGGSTVKIDLATAALSYFNWQSSGSGSLRMELPSLEVIGVKVNRLDPDGKTMYLDMSLSNVKGATHPFWAIVRHSGTTANFPT
jgi:tail tube protein